MNNILKYYGIQVIGDHKNGVDFMFEHKSALAFHWLPPMFLVDNGRNSLYFPGNLKKQILIALAFGHAEKNFNSIGALI